MIRAAYKWTGLYMPEAHFLAFGLQSGKFLERNIALNGEMLKRWTQVLSNGQDINVVLAHIVHHLNYLVPRLTQPQHEARFCGCGRIHLLRPLEYLERTFVNILGSHTLIEPGNG